MEREREREITALVREIPVTWQRGELDGRDGDDAVAEALLAG